MKGKTTLRQVQAVIFSEKGVLLLKKRDIKFEKGKWFRTGQSFWRLPKGKLEKGEGEKQGLKRELREETALKKIGIGRKFFAYQYESPKGVLRKVSTFLVQAREKPRMTSEGKEEGIEKMRFFGFKEAVGKLHWKPEKTALKKASKLLKNNSTIKY